MRPLVKEHNLATDTVINREMTDEEYLQHLADQVAAEARRKTEAAKEQARKVLLDRLGITADEAKLLLS